MMKNLLMLLAFIAFTLGSTSQTILYEDDFESYTVAGYIAEQSEWWTTWSNAPGTAEDALIVTEQANSPSKSVKIEGSSDLLLPMGNLVSGKYQVEFYYFIPTGFGGYFNFQHFESPGVEWAMEVFFGNNGSGTMNAGGENAATFTYPMNQWIHNKTIIDLDADWAEYYLNDNLIYGWQWSLQAQGQPGANQLGGLNIYAGAPTGQTSKYFMDDITWTELVAGDVPVIMVDPTEFVVDIGQQSIESEMLNVANVGTADLEYDLEVNYVFASGKNQPIQSSVTENHFTAKNPALNLIHHSAPTSSPEPEGNAGTVILNYDGPNNGGVGFPNPTVYEVAARFPNSMTLPYAGMELTKVDLYLYHTDDCSFKVKVYGEGTAYEPGALLAEQTINATFPDWYSITLNTPITLTGEDIWVGYWVAQSVGAIYPIGSDEGPANPDGHFIKPGVGWTVSNLDYNWNIRALLEGDAATHWLSVTPEDGVLEPAENMDHTVTFDATDLDLGNYEGKLKVKSNDIVNPVVEVPVMLEVLTGINELGEANAIMVYPNPATEYLQINANHEIRELKLFSTSGQLMLSKLVEAQTTSLSTADLAPGIYFLQIESIAGLSNRKVIVR